MSFATKEERVTNFGAVVAFMKISFLACRDNFVDVLLQMRDKYDSHQKEKIRPWRLCPVACLADICDEGTESLSMLPSLSPSSLYKQVQQF